MYQIVIITRLAFWSVFGYANSLKLCERESFSVGSKKPIIWCNNCLVDWRKLSDEFYVNSKLISATFVCEISIEFIFARGWRKRHRKSGLHWTNINIKSWAKRKLKMMNQNYFLIIVVPSDKLFAWVVDVKARHGEKSLNNFWSSLMEPQQCMH